MPVSFRKGASAQRWCSDSCWVVVVVICPVAVWEEAVLLKCAVCNDEAVGRLQVPRCSDAYGWANRRLASSQKEWAWRWHV
eukprot:6470902-Amphidinium_carterae.1